MKRLLILIAMTLALPLMANAQTRYTPAELDTLVSTIALYPDPLLVHVLNATTHGDDLPSAYAFAKAHRNLKGDDLAKSIEKAELDYDESVIALIPFPDVLYKLAKYATWAHQLGEAVDMQKADVMDAVQRMRKVAHKNGYLQSDDKIEIKVDDNITIQPTQEEYVYVPEYDPRVIYYVVSDNNVRIRYINGTWTGAGLVYWGWDPFVYDWVHRRPHYRHPHRYAPPPPRHHPKRTHYIRYKNTPPPPPPRSNTTWDHRPPAPQPQSNNLRKPAPPPPQQPNYKRPAPPPPPQYSDDEDKKTHRAERHHNSHNAPPPPSRRRR